MEIKESYTAKVLLFGEYSILLGSSALSIPYAHFTAALGFIGENNAADPDFARDSNRTLKELAENYSRHREYFGDILDLDLFIEEVEEGLYLESTIPKSYGLGSSGALCAAIYARYALNRIQVSSRLTPVEILALKEIFQNMESVFHSRSSGFDPLVIYLNFPLHINNKGIPEIIRFRSGFNKTNAGIFLLDSGLAVKTGAQVRLFLDKYAPAGLISYSGKELCSLTNACITSVIKGEIPSFFWSLHALSLFQFEGFEPMIPAGLRPVWKDGLDKGLFYLKLCGSGGGGFVMGFTTDYPKALTYFRERKQRILPVILSDRFY